MPGSAAFVSKKGAVSMRSISCRHFASGNSWMGATCWMPALFTRMSTLPSAAMVSSTSRLQSSSLSIFAAMKRAPGNSAATAFPCSSSMSEITTCAPRPASSRAMASPMPLAAPVTMATLPANSAILRILSRSHDHSKKISTKACHAERQRSISVALAADPTTRCFAAAQHDTPDLSNLHLRRATGASDAILPRHRHLNQTDDNQREHQADDSGEDEVVAELQETNEHRNHHQRQGNALEQANRRVIAVDGGGQEQHHHREKQHQHGARDMHVHQRRLIQTKYPHHQPEQQGEHGKRA